jgi:hypothetical protein
MTREFWLERASPGQLKMAPECIYSAVPCCGVFKSEEAFVHYLRRYDVPKYGDADYFGIRGEKERETPLRIYQMNYEVVPVKDSKRQLTIADMRGVGCLAVVTHNDGSLRGHYLLKTALGIVDITDPTIDRLMDNIQIRLVEPGETVVLRGR